MKTLDAVCYLLVLIGALNWGLVGIFNFNLVELIFARFLIERIVYVLVGVSAVYLILSHNSIKMRCCSKK